MGNKKEEITIDLLNVLEKKYGIRKTGKNGASYEVTVPREVLIREARRLDISEEEITKKFDVVWRYNNFRGSHMEIVKKEEKAK